MGKMQRTSQFQLMALSKLWEISCKSDSKLFSSQFKGKINQLKHSVYKLEINQLFIRHTAFPNTEN
jgi:hypothetical protein